MPSEVFPRGNARSAETLREAGRAHRRVRGLTVRIDAAQAERRQAISRAYLDGHSLQAIGDALGVSRGRIEQLRELGYEAQLSVDLQLAAGRNGSGD